MKKYLPWMILLSWLVFILVLLFVLPGVSQANEVNGLLESMDTNFSFSPTQLVGILESYGREGRSYYVLQRWTFDLYYPLVYGVPISLSLYGLLNHTKYQRIAWLGLIASTMDYVENVVFTIAALTFPSHTLGWVTIGVIFSVAKWLALGGGFFLVLVLVIRRLFLKKNV
jgi:hypothetical protein